MLILDIAYFLGHLV